MLIEDTASYERRSRDLCRSWPRVSSGLGISLKRTIDPIKTSCDGFDSWRMEHCESLGKPQNCLTPAERGSPSGVLDNGM